MARNQRDAALQRVGGDGGAPSSPPLLWPLLALPDDVAERLLSRELGDQKTKRALRLVSRASRSFVDARVRSVHVGKLGYLLCGYKVVNLASFPALETVALDASCERVLLDLLPVVTRDLPSLRRLKELKLDAGAEEGDASAVPAIMADFVRALPPTLEKLDIKSTHGLPEARALVEAAASLPALRSLKFLTFTWEYRRDLHAALGRTARLGGAWANLRELSLENVKAETYAALSEATRLTALHKLELRRCDSHGRSFWQMDGPETPPHLSEDGGLRLLAKAPWIQQLTKLRLEGVALHTRDQPPTDLLFEGGLVLPRLETLEITRFGLRPTGLATAKLPALSSLKLCSPTGGPSTDTLRAIAAAPWFVGLKELELAINDSMNVSHSAPLLSLPFRALSKLTVYRPRTEDVAAIAASRGLHPSLRSLALWGVEDDRALNDASCWKALAKAPLAALRELEATFECWCNALHIIETAPWASQLTSLNLLTPEDFEDDGPFYS